MKGENKTKMEITKRPMNLRTYEGGYIDLINERILIPIFFNKKLDIEGIQKAFNECLNELINNEEKVLNIFK